MIEGGPKVGLKILKPSKSLGGSSLGLTHNPFDDGSKIEPILLGENLRSIRFQVADPKLNGGNHVSMMFPSNKGKDPIGKIV